MSTKTSQLQIRVSPEQKAALKRLASDAELTVSAYVLSVVLPSAQREFATFVKGLRRGSNRSKALSDLMLFLAALSREEFPATVADVELANLPRLLQNYVAAAVEQEAMRKGVAPPSWVDVVEPPSRPNFAWDLPSLRPHLMRVTPLAFKRRNVFIAAVGDARR